MDAPLRFEDRVLEAVFEPGAESLLLLSRAGAPRGRLMTLALRPSGLLGPPQPFLPEGEAVLEASFAWDPTSKIVPAEKHLYLVEQLGGPQRVRVLDGAGEPLGTVPLPEASAVFQVLPEPGRDALLVQSASYVEPTTWYRYEPGADGGADGSQRRPCPSSSRSACVTPRSRASGRCRRTARGCRSP